MNRSQPDPTLLAQLVAMEDEYESAEIAPADADDAEALAAEGLITLN
jgi:hypothetical protein